MTFEKTGPGVFVPREGSHTICVDARTIAAVEAELAQSPTGRARVCLHEGADAFVHEMVIAIRRGSYVRPHRHPDKHESLTALRGRATAVFFDEEGQVVEVRRLGPLGEGDALGYRLPTARFHTLLPETDVFWFYEVTTGPLSVESTEMAPWAPPPGDEGAAQAYLADLHKQVSAEG